MFQFVHVYNLWTVSETACSYCSHLPFSLCSSWVIVVIIIFMQMCWFIPNCTQNQVITYTNSIEEVFYEQLHFFSLKAISSKNVKFNTTPELHAVMKIAHLAKFHQTKWMFMALNCWFCQILVKFAKAKSAWQKWQFWRILIKLTK